MLEMERGEWKPGFPGFPNLKKDAERISGARRRLGNVDYQEGEKRC